MVNHWESLGKQSVLENRTTTANVPARRRRIGADLPKPQRAKRTNYPLAGVETNKAHGRRIADLAGAYFRVLGNPTGIEQQAAIVAAAELQVLAEETRAAALKQIGTFDLDQVVRVEGAAARALRRLGVDRKREPAVPTLAEHLAKRAVEPSVILPGR
jgi:hypothetical protein